MIKLRVEKGFVTEAPVYEEHWRGRNWAATIALDPRSPGGIHRTWWERGQGDFLYGVPAGLRPGTPVEFGALARGRRSPLRWYGVVVEITDDHITLEKCSTAREAVERAQEVASAETVASETAPESAPATPATVELAGVDDSTLAAELTRRGWVVFAPATEAPGRGIYAVIVAGGRVKVGMIGATVSASDPGIVYRGDAIECATLARKLVRAGLETDTPALRV